MLNMLIHHAIYGEDYLDHRCEILNIFSADKTSKMHHCTDILVIILATYNKTWLVIFSDSNVNSERDMRLFAKDTNRENQRIKSTLAFC